MENKKQSRIVFIGNISPTVADYDISTETLKLLATIKAATKVDENVEHNEENPVNWDKEEASLWLNLSCDVDISLKNSLSGWQLLRLSEKEFISFITSNSSVDSITGSLIHEEIWQVYADCRNKERDKKLRIKAKFETKVSKLKCY